MQPAGRRRKGEPPTHLVKITWARPGGSATTDFAKLVNHFQPTGETAGSEALQPRPCGFLNDGRERNRVVAAVGATANPSTENLSEQTDFDSSASWRFLPTATGRSNSSTGSLRFGDASAALGPERHPFSSEVCSPPGSPVWKLQVGGDLHNDLRNFSASKWIRRCTPLGGRGLLPASDVLQLGSSALSGSATGSVCGSRITGGKSLLTGFRTARTRREVRATRVNKVREPRQPTRLRRQATPLARGWFHLPAQEPLQGRPWTSSTSTYSSSRGAEGLLSTRTWCLAPTTPKGQDF